MKLERGASGYVVDAADLGPLLGVAAPEVPELMRLGEITSIFEAGKAEDLGRFRLTFFYKGISLRLTCQDDGTVLTRRRITLPKRPLPRGGSDERGV